jgi:hypothetical protein
VFESLGDRHSREANPHLIRDARDIATADRQPQFAKKPAQFLVFVCGQCMAGMIHPASLRHASWHFANIERMI